MLLPHLLPGLRELRAPLAAGYLWLAVAWLWWHDDIPSRESATGVWDAIYDVGDALGPAALPLLVSFAVYIVGSLSTDFIRMFTQQARDLEGSYLRLRVSERGERSLAAYAKVLLRRVEEGGGDLAHGFGALVAGPKGWEELSAEVRHRSGRYATIDRRSEFDPEEPLPAGHEDTDIRAERRKPPHWVLEPEGVPAKPNSGSRPEVPPHAVLAALVESEFELITTRLIGLESELYSAVDRLTSEAELRLALSVPSGAFVISAVLTGASPWWLFGLCVSAALIAQAALRYQGAGDILVQALSVGRVEAPVVERFIRRAGIDPAHLHAAVTGQATSSAPGESSVEPRDAGPNGTGVESLTAADPATVR